MGSPTLMMIVTGPPVAIEPITIGGPAKSYYISVERDVIIESMGSISTLRQWESPNSS